MHHDRLDDGAVRPAMPIKPAAAVGAIRRMTAAVRAAVSERADEGGEPGWWVLAQGESLAGQSFERRDQARERLREAVEAAGVVLAQYVWVHDDRERAQLVVATLPSRERAGKVAERLARRGISVRVAREVR